VPGGVAAVARGPYELTAGSCDLALAPTHVFRDAELHTGGKTTLLTRFAGVIPDRDRWSL